ncbi:MAG: peptidase domain-containing ABC transporter [Pseudomonadales bacterium]|nr:peptidase domain-containing ABC transporter [Pseudomonadales bacterium]
MISFFEAPKSHCILQSEASECGLACLAMVLNYYGSNVDLASMRQRHETSLKGLNLYQLMAIANDWKLQGRALKVEIEELEKIRLPTIIHWEFNHFVVLVGINKDGYQVLDPSCGPRKIKRNEFSEKYTGIALELTPTVDFKPKTERKSVSLTSVFKRIPGFNSSLMRLFLLALALQSFSLISPFYIQMVVDQVLLSGDQNFLTVLAIGFILLLLIQTLITLFRSWLTVLFGTHLDYQLQQTLFTHMLRLPLQYYEKRHIGDIMSRFDSLKQVQRAFSSNFIEAVIDGIMVLTTLAVMYIYSPSLSLVAVIAVVLYGGMRVMLFRPLRNASEQQIVHGAKQQSYFLESLRAIQSIKLNGVESTRSGHCSNLMADTCRAGMRVEKYHAIYRMGNSLVSGLENIIVIWIAALAIMEGSFSVGMLFAFIAYKRQFISRTTTLIDRLMEFSMLGLHLHRLADLALEPQEEHKGNITLPKDFSIEIANVSYHYSDSEPPVFQNLNFKVLPGESVAIIGPSGVGKSTFLKLMLGIYTPSDGTIKYGGIDYRKINRSNICQRVAAVLQEDQLVAGSLINNIAFGEMEADLERVYWSAEIARIRTDIEAMPMGFHSLIGDMGTVLSSGQKQRVLLARAIYKKASVLFLDEATSHLDVETEQAVNDSLALLGITKVIVAHRPKTISSADRVVILTKSGIHEVTRDDKGNFNRRSSSNPLQDKVGPASISIADIPTSKSAQAII